MQFLTDIVIGILATYLTLTNTLAHQIIQIQSPNTKTAEFTETVIPPKNRTPYAFSRISSVYQAIPKILIENTSYQSANVHSAETQLQDSATPIEALVNIVCTYTTEEYVRATTGTGYFIDSDGIILTNAHVAQFLLLEDIEGLAECTIRTGNPAEPTFKADLLYISPAWVQKHANLINQERPQGTGERDYALLYVTAGLNNKPMPRHFPALSFDAELLRVSAINSTVHAAGYPAQTLLEEGDSLAQLVPKEATTTITELMTFGSNYADIFTITGSNIGEQGSSGGPVVNKNGDAIGLISTRGDDVLFGAGSLRAITLSYIDRTILEETGFGLQRNLGGNLPYRAQLFKETLVPFLRQTLQWELEKE